MTHDTPDSTTWLIIAPIRCPDPVRDMGRRHDWTVVERIDPSGAARITAALDRACVIIADDSDDPDLLAETTLCIASLDITRHIACITTSPTTQLERRLAGAGVHMLFDADSFITWAGALTSERSLSHQRTPRAHHRPRPSPDANGGIVR